MPKQNMRGGARKPAKKGTLKRLLKMLYQGNKGSLIAVLISVLY